MNPRPRLILSIVALAVPLAIALGGPTSPPPGSKPKPKAISPKIVPPPAPVQPENHPSGPDDPHVYYKNDLAEYTTQNEQLLMKGNVVFEYKDTIFKSQKVLYDRPGRIASSPEPVQLDDSQNTITGDRGTAYYKLTTSKIEGNVKIIARPDQKASASGKGIRKDFDSPVTIRCKNVTYNWKTKIAIPTGDITINFNIKNKKGPKEWTVTSNTMEYDGKIETVYLRGNVKGTTKDGERVNGETGTVLLKAGEEQLKLTMSKNNKLNYDTVDEEPEKKDEKAATPPPKKPGGSGSDVVQER